MKFLTNRCPHCNEGSIFKAPYEMNAYCPKCNYHFEKEPGYFTGAMVIGYVIGSFLMIPTIVILFFAFQWSWPSILIFASLQTILLNPLIFWLARVLWIKLDYTRD